MAASLQASTCFDRLERVDNVHDRLLEAAHAVFAEEGFRGATTRKIAARARVNEVTLFRHFASKEELLAEAVGRQVEASIARLEGSRLPAEPADVAGELQRFLTATLFGFVAAHQAVRTSLGEWGHHPVLDDRLTGTSRYVSNEVERYLVAAQGRGLIRADIDHVVAAQALISAIFAHGMLHEMMPERFPLGPAESVAMYLKIMLEGLWPGKREGDAG
jgi:AcrR family transcriptional regulator